MTLDYAQRLLVLVLGTYALVCVPASLLLATSWHHALRRDDVSPSATARLLLLARFAPALLSLTTATLSAIAFGMFEPSHDQEFVGRPALVSAAVGAVLWLASAGRAATIAWSSHRLRRYRRSPAARLPGCSVEAYQVPLDFPVLALVGVCRPFVIVSQRLLQTCTESELEVMVAHELAHLRSRDNLWRLLFALCPDALTGTRAGTAVEDAWNEVVEHLADESAAGNDSQRRLALASALLKVARLATRPPSPPSLSPIAASTLFRGEPVAERVRSLIEGTRCRSGGTGRAGLWILATASTAALGAGFCRLPELFGLAEGLLRLGA